MVHSERILRVVKRASKNLPSVSSSRLSLANHRIAAEHASAARTVNVTGLRQRVLERATARANAFEGVIAADDAMHIIGIVGAEATTYRAALGDAWCHSERRRGIST